MDGKAELLGRLHDWAASAGVTPVWVRGALRLQLLDGTAKAVIAFPENFWETFATASPGRREDALDVIANDVYGLYEPEWTHFDPKVIEVHSTLLRE